LLNDLPGKAQGVVSTGAPRHCVDASPQPRSITTALPRAALACDTSASRLSRESRPQEVCLLATPQHQQSRPHLAHPPNTLASNPLPCIPVRRSQPRTTLPPIPLHPPPPAPPCLLPFHLLARLAHNHLHHACAAGGAVRVPVRANDNLALPDETFLNKLGHIVVEDLVAPNH